jgi:hypothetical protein
MHKLILVLPLTYKDADRGLILNFTEFHSKINPINVNYFVTLSYSIILKYYINTP